MILIDKLSYCYLLFFFVTYIERGERFQENSQGLITYQIIFRVFENSDEGVVGTTTYNDNKYPVTFKFSEVYSYSGVNEPAKIDSGRISYLPVQ